MGRVHALLWLALLAAVCAAAEPDGAVAAPARWNGPHGPAGSTRRSRALPIVRDVVEAWSAELPGRAAAPPVTWDGIVYVLCEGGRGRILVALDLSTRRIVAKKFLPKAETDEIHVWGGVVYVAASPNQLSGLKRSGGGFVERSKWSVSAHHYAVLENEIYVAGGGSLQRFAPGYAKPIWEQSGYTPPVAVYGAFVLAVSTGGRRGAKLDALTRAGGRVRSSVTLAYTGGLAFADGDITVGPTHVLVGSQSPFDIGGGRVATHGFVPYSSVGGGDQLRLGKTDGFMRFGVKPAVYKNGVVTCGGKSEWQWWVGDQGRVLARKTWTPDLFEHIVPPTVLGDVVYFGTWAADVETGEILWRLPLRSVDFGAVPADRLVLVTADGYLRAYRSRVGK